jgi:hypothetical protein
MRMLIVEVCRCKLLHMETAVRLKLPCCQPTLAMPVSSLTAVCRRNTKNGKCAACEQPTQGIFNIATDILKKMKKAKAAAPKENAAAGEEGD